MTLATRHGDALIRRVNPEPANDNVPGTVTPDDDGPSLLALGLVCAVVAVLVVYVGMSGPEDVMAVLRR